MLETKHCLVSNLPYAFATLIAAASLISSSAISTSLADPCDRPTLRVAVDVGHSVRRPGAISASGKTEYSFNERLARELVEDSRSFPSLDLFVLEPREKTLSQRPREAVKSGADVLVSIHHDSVNEKYKREWLVEGATKLYSDAFRGFSLFVWSGSKKFAESLRIAKAIGRHLKATGLTQTLHHAEPIKGENRKVLDWEYGVHDAPFVVLKTSRIPSVLVEVGVIVNRSEERLLESRNHRKLITTGILRALDTCG